MGDNKGSLGKHGGEGWRHIKGMVGEPMLLCKGGQVHWRASSMCSVLHEQGVVATPSNDLNEWLRINDLQQSLELGGANSHQHGRPFHVFLFVPLQISFSFSCPKEYGC